MTTKTVNRIYSDLDLSFAAHPITGDVARKFDVNAVKQALKVLVLTNFYERPFQPKIGSPIYGMMFENVDIVTANSLKLRLELLINKFSCSINSFLYNSNNIVNPINLIFNAGKWGKKSLPNKKHIKM